MQRAGDGETTTPWRPARTGSAGDGAPDHRILFLEELPMVQAQPKPFLSPEEYLAIERESETRSEYFDGEMFAMSGGSRQHNLIVTNLIRELSTQLKRRPCEVYTNDQRVRIPETSLYTYPDVVVLCGEPIFEDETVDTLLNPLLIVEVLSPTTEAYDRGKKFEGYRTIASLAEYVLVSQHEPRVEQFLRQDGGHWLFTATHGRERSISLASIQCELALAEIYDKVALG
jgi:Uma2 family endonuclease